MDNHVLSRHIPAHPNVNYVEQHLPTGSQNYCILYWIWLITNTLNLIIVSCYLSLLFPFFKCVCSFLFVFIITYCMKSEGAGEWELRRSVLAEEHDSVMSLLPREDEEEEEASGKIMHCLSQARTQREAPNLLSLYEKNSKATRRYWAARCIS